MITLYHNSECSKCREVMKILEHCGKPFLAIEYLKTPPSEIVLDSLLKQLKLEPEQIVRKGEDKYKELESTGKLPKNRKDWIQLFIQHPILIERPIVSDGLTAVIGRPPVKVSEWLDHINKII